MKVFQHFLWEQRESNPRPSACKAAHYPLTPVPALSMAASLLGVRYNPGDEVGLQKELEKDLSHMLALRFDIEHLTGKEAIELVRK